MKIFSAGNFNNDWSATGRRPDRTSFFLKNLIRTYLRTVRTTSDRILLTTSNGEKRRRRWHSASTHIRNSRPPLGGATYLSTKFSVPSYPTVLS